MRIVKKSIVSIIGVMAFLCFAPLEMVHSVWRGFVLGQQRVASSGFIKEAYATVLSTVDEVLHTFLPDAEDIKEEIRMLTAEQKKAIEEKAKVDFDPLFDREFHFFIGRTNGYLVGYAIKDTIRGKWGPIHYMLSLDPAGKIVDVVVLEYKEKRGLPVAKGRFLKQFVGKTMQNKLKLKKDIRGVSGATISSRSMTNGIRKLVYVFNEFYPTQ